ncbi:MspA family porin [Gordonia alkaliphila]|uniref:MspA family porin n=1 Tax=Gordonia alkaliphila TaxID=1053547 RepID=UPI001FF6E945|nr:MspA family porin [Gordonia alkaliphila]MCK0439711.1 MspA family porin [Gordonia alkaliphila]
MKNLTKRVVAPVAVAGAAMIALTGVTAGVAEAKNLPGATKTRSFDEGSVTIRLFDESARITRAVTNVPTSREVQVSGKVAVTTKGGVKGGNINVGYLVGCQLSFDAGGGVSGGGTYTFNPSGNASPFAPSGGVTGTAAIAPGQAVYVPVIKASIGGNPVNSFDFNNARGGVAYSQERFGVDGCAGYAEAMAKVTVKVSTDTFKGNITMYGKPFSLG